jgi:predicted nucleic acid-binding protein
MIVVDANVLIGHIESTDPNNLRAAALLNTAAGSSIGTSLVTLAEVLVRPAKTGRLRETESKLRELKVMEIPFGKYAPVRLAILRSETGLKMPDCCVLLAAEDGEASGILTLDEQLRMQATRLGFDCPDVQP